MSYMHGGYLAGDAGLTDDDALDQALSQATSDKQLINYKFYYQKIAALSPAARANLITNLNAVLARLPPKVHDLVVQMGNRTASYADPRAVIGIGLGQVAAAAGAANTVSTIAAITGIVATLGTIGLQVATTLDQRQQAKSQASDAKKAEQINQKILQAQLDEQQLRLNDLKAQSAAKNVAAGPGIGPDGSLLVPAKTSTATIATGIALTGAAAYMLTR